MRENLVLSETAVAAMRLAATERPAGQSLTTGRVLSALTRVDMTNDWQRIWLHTGDPLLPDLAAAPDPPGALPVAGSDVTGLQVVREPERWEGVPLSDSLAGALKLLNRICSTYDLVPAPSGAMALALLADPSNGATQALLRSGGLPHAKLLELVQSDLLDTTLNGVGDLIAASSGAASAVPLLSPAATASAPPTSGVAGGPGATVAARRRVRRRVRRWQALSCLALVLAAMAIFWNRQVVPSSAPLVVPPYPVPAVARQMLKTADLPPAGTGGWLQMENGPPATPLFTSTGRFRADLRNTVFASAWQRTWQTADSRDLLQVTAYVARTRAAAVGFMTGQCAPAQERPLPGITAAGYVDRNPGAAETCAMALRGRTVLLVRVMAQGSTANTVAWHLLTFSAERQASRVAATATDLPVGKFLTTDSITAYNSLLMGVIVAIPLLLGLITVVRDRSSWRRLRSRLSVSTHLLSLPGADRTLGTFPVDPLVSVRVARLTALALARIAVIVWSVRLSEHWYLDVQRTGVAVAATIAGILVVEWLIRRRATPASWQPAIFVGRRWVIGAVSLLLSAGTAGAGVFLVIYGVIVSATGVAAPGASNFASVQFARGLLVVGGVLIVAALLPFTMGRRLGMRALRNHAAKERPADEERHPVLILRSFADDRRLLRARRSDRASIVERLCLRRFERFEEVAAATLAVHGPVLALSQPKEKLPPPLGAERRSFSKDDWQVRIRDLISAARLICVTVGRSESLLWEIGRIRAAGALDRAIFLLPPTSKREQRRRLMVLEHALGIDYGLMDATRSDRDVLAVVFPSGDAASGAIPVVITGSAPDDVGYEAAIGAWALAVTGDQRSFPSDLRQLSADLVSYAASGAPEVAAEALAVQAARPAAARPDPKRLIYRPGKAPVYKPFSRRLLDKRVVFSMLSLIVLPAAMQLIGANNAPSQTIHAHYPVTVLAGDEVSTAVYAVLGGHLIVQLDFSHPGAPRQTHVSDFINFLVVHGPDAYYASMPVGRVGRVDLRTGRTLWVRSVPPGVQSPVLVDGRVVVTSPATSQVIELSAADGRVLARRTLPGTAYNVAVVGKTLYVTLARKNAVAELDADTLAPLATVPVPAGPRDIYAAGSQVWVECMLAHQLVPIGAPAARPVFLSIQDAWISSNAGLLAVQGMEWVSVLSPDGQLTKIPIVLTDVNSVVAQKDGAVIVGYGSGEIDKYGPGKS